METKQLSTQKWMTAGDMRLRDAGLPRGIAASAPVHFQPATVVRASARRPAMRVTSPLSNSKLSWKCTHCAGG